MKLYGLIGQPLTHSFSEIFFREKFRREQILDAEYKLFPIDTVFEVFDLIKVFPTLRGFSVTIPFKEKIMDILDEIDETAKTIGAVNLIKIITDNDKIILKGYNSDIYGFQQTISPYLEKQKYKALILGTGGASKAVEHVLKQNDIQYRFVTRPPYKNDISLFYSELNKEIIEEYKLIINTTPLGMFPDTDYYPNIPYEYLTKDHILYDLIYNPAETQFLKFGRFKKAITINGLQMLYSQAEKAWQIFGSV